MALSDDDPPDDIEVVIFARRYVSEAASKVQFEDFDKFLKRNDIDGTSAYRMEDIQHGAYVVAVVDVSGRATEFPWAGDPHELSQQQVDALLERVRFGEAKVHYGEAIRPVLMSDGTWRTPRPQG